MVGGECVSEFCKFVVCDLFVMVFVLCVFVLIVVVWFVWLSCLCVDCDV